MVLIEKLREFSKPDKVNIRLLQDCYTDAIADGKSEETVLIEYHPDKSIFLYLWSLFWLFAAFSIVYSSFSGKLIITLANESLMNAASLALPLVMIAGCIPAICFLRQYFTDRHRIAVSCSRIGYSRSNGRSTDFHYIDCSLISKFILQTHWLRTTCKIVLTTGESVTLLRTPMSGSGIAWTEKIFHFLYPVPVMIQGHSAAHSRDISCVLLSSPADIAEKCKRIPKKYTAELNDSAAFFAVVKPRALNSNQIVTAAIVTSIAVLAGIISQKSIWNLTGIDEFYSSRELHIQALFFLLSFFAIISCLIEVTKKDYLFFLEDRLEICQTFLGGKYARIFSKSDIAHFTAEQEMSNQTSIYLTTKSHRRLLVLRCCTAEKALYLEKINTWWNGNPAQKC